MTLSIRTLTAVAALSLGTAAWAQDAQTITVPLSDPSEPVAAPERPGTTIVVQDGQTRVESAVGNSTPADQLATSDAAPASATSEAAEDPANVDTETDATIVDTAAGAEAVEVDEADAVETEAVVEEAAADETAADAEPAGADEAEPVAEPADAAAPPAADVTEPAEDAAEPAEDAAEPAADATEPDADADAPAEGEAAIEAPTTGDEEATDGAAHDDVEGVEVVEEGHEDEAAHEDTASHEAHVTDVSFSFEGPFGKFDQFQLQRGLQVYTEVCSSCHGMKQVALRTLSDEGGPGLPEDQMRAYAAAFDIYDAELDEDRPRTPTDHFPTVSGEGMGPDLSLMAKARAGFHGPYGSGISQLFNGIGGPEYIYSVLTGYTGETKEQAGSMFYGNSAFPGGWIAMPAPLSDDLVTYEDGTPATTQQMAKDVAAFLMWTAEPHMMARKKVGFVAVIFLIILSALLYLTNKRLWRPVKYGHH